MNKEIEKIFEPVKLSNLALERQRKLASILRNYFLTEQSVAYLKDGAVHVRLKETRYLQRLEIRLEQVFENKIDYYQICWSIKYPSQTILPYVSKMVDLCNARWRFVKAALYHKEQKFVFQIDAAHKTPGDFLAAFDTYVQLLRNAFMQYLKLVAFTMKEMKKKVNGSDGNESIDLEKYHENSFLKQLFPYPKNDDGEDRGDEKA